MGCHDSITGILIGSAFADLVARKAATRPFGHQLVSNATRAIRHRDMLRIHLCSGEGGAVVQERRKHVFAIDGSPELLNLIRDLFQEEGSNVTTTNYVPTSFDQIETAHPDAVIVDIVIGQDAGWELLEQLGADAD